MENAVSAARIEHVAGTVRIFPEIEQDRACPHCKSILAGGEIVWHGMHILIADRCSGCRAEVRTDLKAGHSLHLTSPVQIDLTHRSVHCAPAAVTTWLGDPLLRALEHPNCRAVVLERERFIDCDRVVILNCIDHLYGHVLLKLLNAQRHIDSADGYGVVILVPKYMAWMVPEGAAEVWTVDIPLREGQDCFPALNEAVRRECRRFREVLVSKAYSHPRRFDIARFTQVPAHDWNREIYRVTFIWREDRPWRENRIARKLRRHKRNGMSLARQNSAVVELFEAVRKAVPNARFTVAGLGSSTSFPNWIDDQRVAAFDAGSERAACRIYSESRVVVGIHGSNMLLPTAHAGMAIVLMPQDRWGNMAQDVLYTQSTAPGVMDPRVLAFRYRYPPQNITPDALSAMLINMIEHHNVISSYFHAEAEDK